MRYCRCTDRWPRLISKQIHSLAVCISLSSCTPRGRCVFSVIRGVIWGLLVVNSGIISLSAIRSNINNRGIERHSLMIHFSGDKKSDSCQVLPKPFTSSALAIPVPLLSVKPAGSWMSLGVRTIKRHFVFLLIVSVWQRSSAGSELVLCELSDCIVLPLLEFTSVCQSNPFDSHVCPGSLCVTLCSCNVLCLQHHRQKWIWAPSAPTSPSLPNYPLLLGQPACPPGLRVEHAARSGGRALYIPMKCMREREVDWVLSLSACGLCVCACAYVT